MSIEFKLPELGENITKADIIAIKIKPGDKVEVDQIVLEIETDKATIEVPSDISGVVSELLVKEGDKASVGQVIFRCEQAGSINIPVQPAEKTVTEQAEQPEESGEQTFSRETVPSPDSALSQFRIPELGENIKTASVAAVKAKAGDIINADTILLELETEKATIEVPSEMNGTIREVLVKAGDKVSTGQTAFIIEAGITQPAPAVAAAAEPVEKTAEEKKDYSVPPLPRTEIDPARLAPAAPTVRRFAREIGVDINKVIGTGAFGRISIADVKAFSREMNRQKEAAPAQQAGPAYLYAEQLPDFGKFGHVERKEMSNVRRKTAEHLSYAWMSVPHVTQFDKADITELEKLRKMYGKAVESQGGKLTVTAIILKVVASALKAFPQFNSSVDMGKNEIIYKKYYNIGVAVDTERGLIVPVIKDVDKKNIIELSIELSQIAEKAKNKKVTLDDMQGGCMTITNLGGIGGTYFTPIVNTPEVAILGISRSQFEPVYMDGKFEPRQMLPLSLSYDHRVIDGADGIRFLSWIINALQQPFLMALKG